MTTVCIERAWDFSNGELLGEFMKACARAGVANSGLVFDPCGGSYKENAQFLCGIVHARLDGASVPFKAGYRVRAKNNPVTPDVFGLKMSGHPRMIEGVLVVRDVWYWGNQTWKVRFRGDSQATADRDSTYAEDGGEEWSVPLFFKTGDFELAHQPFQEIQAQTLERLFEFAKHWPRFTPSDLVRQFKMTWAESLSILTFLSEAGYIKEIPLWFKPDKSEEGMRGFQFA